MARQIPDPGERTDALVRLCSDAPHGTRAASMEEAVGIQLRSAYELTGPGQRSDLPGRLACLAWVARRLGCAQYEEWANRALALLAFDEDVYGSGDGLYVRDALHCARVLSYTHPDAGRQAVERVLTRWGGIERIDPDCSDAVVSAAAEVDVNWAIDLLRRLPRREEEGRPVPPTNAALAIVDVLVEDAETRELHFLSRTGNRLGLPIDLPPVDHGPLRRYG